VPLLEYFGEPTPKPCGNCDNCLDPPALHDATEAARKLLSAVFRTGQRFGAGHVIDVLLGKSGEKITRFGHDRLTVFGIGKDLSSDGWKALARQLEAGEALVRDGEFGGLVLGPAARAILKGEVPVSLKVVSDRPRRGRGATAAASLAAVADDDVALFEALRAVRRQLAAAASLPPYVIFHDSTLRAMAAARPRTAAALGRIPGVGERKLASYGAAFLAAIAAAP
jgi:ATP-dependent DNA helicase RecQ